MLTVSTPFSIKQTAPEKKKYVLYFDYRKVLKIFSQFLLNTGYEENEKFSGF